MNNDVQPTVMRSKSSSDSRYNVCGESVMAPANCIKKLKCISDNFFSSTPSLIVVLARSRDDKTSFLNRF